MCHSPKLIAAYHVLLRLSNPRHPPHALSNFKIFKLLGFLILLTRRYVKELSPGTDNVLGDNPTPCIPGIVKMRALTLSSSIICCKHKVLVEDIGIEPITSCLQSRRSSQMS